MRIGVTTLGLSCAMLTLSVAVGAEPTKAGSVITQRTVSGKGTPARTLDTECNKVCLYFWFAQSGSYYTWYAEICPGEWCSYDSPESSFPSTTFCEGGCPTAVNCLDLPSLVAAKAALSHPRGHAAEARVRSGGLGAPLPAAWEPNTQLPHQDCRVIMPRNRHLYATISVPSRNAAGTIETIAIKAKLCRLEVIPQGELEARCPSLIYGLGGEVVNHGNPPAGSRLQVSERNVRFVDASGSKTKYLLALVGGMTYRVLLATEITVP